MPHNALQCSGERTARPGKPSVRSRIGTVGAEERMPGAGASGERPAMPPLMWEVAEPVDHHVEERDRYARALARLRAPDERSEGGDGGVGPRADIAHGHANPSRLPRARYRDEAGLPLPRCGGRARSAARTARRARSPRCPCRRSGRSARTVGSSSPTRSAQPGVKLCRKTSLRATAVLMPTVRRIAASGATLRLPRFIQTKPLERPPTSNPTRVSVSPRLAVQP